MADGENGTFAPQVRMKVYEIITSAPGITSSVIQGKLDVPEGEVEHILNELIDRELLIVRIEGGENHYYLKKRKKKEKNEAYELEARTKIFDQIRRAPGLHLREIQKRLDIPLGTVEYHLKYFEEKDMAIVRREGGYKRYYPKMTMGSEDRKLLSLLRQMIPRRVVLFLMNHPDSSFGDIAQSLEMPPSSLSFHVKKLVKADAIARIKKGRVSFFHVNDPNRILSLLQAHKRSFLDELVDRFIKTWTEYHP